MKTDQEFPAPAVLRAKALKQRGPEGPSSFLSSERALARVQARPWLAMRHGADVPKCPAIFARIGSLLALSLCVWFLPTPGMAQVLPPATVPSGVLPPPASTLTAGAAVTWGLSDHCQLGDGNTASSSLPVNVSTAFEFVAIDGGGSSGVLGQSMAIDSDGDLWA